MKRRCYFLPLVIVLVLGLVVGKGDEKARRATVAIYHQILFSWFDDDPFEVKEECEYDFVGTGVFVSPNLVLTASHNRPIPLYDETDPYERDYWAKSVIRVVVKPFGDENYYLTTQVFAPPNDDVLLLRVIGYKSKHYLPLGKPKERRDCYVPTYLDGVPVELTARIQKVDFVIDWGVEWKEEKRLILFSPSVYPGVSGSPLVQDGKVVGIAVGRLPTRYPFGLAYPIDIVRKFLQTKVSNGDGK